MEAATNCQNLRGTPTAGDMEHQVAAGGSAGEGLHRDTNQMLPGLKEEKLWEMEISLWRRRRSWKRARTAAGRLG